MANSSNTSTSVNCVIQKKTENVTLQKCDNLSILWLKGTPTERAQAHGELIGKEFTEENLKLFLELSVRGLDKNSFKFTLIDKALNYLVKWAASNAPDSYFKETEAMAIAAGQDPLKLRRALLLPDISAFSWALLSKQGKNLPSQGCTSAVYTNNTDEFVQGRNLDFPGSPSYDQNPLLVVHTPEAGSKELKHVSIGTQGLQFSGITGFNEAGITFAVHQNYTRLLSIKGVPMPYVGELVLRSAHNLQEAVEIIKSNRPGPLWTFILSDLNTKESMTVEVSNTHFNIRKKDGPLFAQTNHLFGELKKELTLMDAGTVENSEFRFQKALKEMQTWKTGNAEEMAKLLAWQKNTQSFSPVSDVMKSLTIQSVIYEKTIKEKTYNFYVTMDSAPAPTGRWLKFNFDDFFNKSTFTNSDVQVFNFIQLPSTIRANQKKWTEIYSYEIMRHYPEVIERLSPLAASPDAFLALSAMYGKTSNSTQALISAKKGLALVNQDTPVLISQGLKWMQIVSLWNLDNEELVLSEAQKLSE